MNPGLVMPYMQRASWARLQQGLLFGFRVLACFRDWDFKVSEIEG